MLIKVVDFLTWIMLIITFVVSILTTIVMFGITWDSSLYYFLTFRPLEICLALTFFLWGITSLLSPYNKKGGLHCLYAFILGGILIVFMLFGVY